MADQGRLAIVRTSHLNAWSVAEASRALGIETRTTHLPAIFPIRAFCASDSAHVVAELFTEEQSLRAALTTAGTGEAIYYPRSFPLALLDDKAAMSEWLATVGERPIPFSTQLGGLSFPVFVKSRHSWVDGVSRPRGWICRDASALTQALQQIAAAGSSETEYFAQAWLGDDDQQVYSVCGFFDFQQPARNLLVATRKVAGYQAGVGSSAVVATVEDPAGLIERASSILAQLEYSGPFELEFLHHAGDYLVIELNPRFWLQNGIFLRYGNGLMKRCLDADGAGDWDGSSVPVKALWVDSLWLTQRLLRLDLRSIRTIWPWWREGYAICPSPSVRVLLFKLTPRLVRRRLRFRFRKT